jgi:type I restriction enzyme S subunit
VTSIPDTWETVTTEQVCLANEPSIMTGPFGSNLGREDFMDTGVPVLTIGSLGYDKLIREKLLFVHPDKAQELSAYRLKVGDLLFSRMADVGRVGFVPADLEGAIYNYHLIRLRLDNEVICPEYYYHYVRGSQQVATYLDEVNRGATRDGINTKLLAALPVALPPLAEQRRIVAKLDSLTARTARARSELDHIPRLVEKYKQAILTKAFSGELTKEWRKQQPKLQHATELVRGTAEPEQSRGGREATDTVKPGIAAISVNDPGTTPPEGWAWVPLRRIARQETGHTPSRSKPEYWDGGVPWIGIKDAGAHHGHVIKETLQTISELGLENSSARLLPAGTVCLSRTASVGYVTVMGKRMATSQDFATWTCTEALDPKYLMYALIAEGEHIKEFGEGSTHTTIYFPEIRAFNICLAPKLEQAEIVRRIEAALAKVNLLAIEHARASHLVPKLDQSILAKAFRGELVPQDPNDEPASVLLERIRRASNRPSSAATSLSGGAGRRRRKQS